MLRRTSQPDAEMLDRIEALHAEHPAPCALFTTVMGKCTCQQPTLTDFLLARIADDESELPYLFSDGETFDVAGRSIELRPRVLAECKTKRQIVEDFEEYAAEYRKAPSDFAAGRRHAALLALTRAASVYADHPDFRDEWRP